MVLTPADIRIYPFLFAPNQKTLVWGTEDWTVSAVPGSESVVSNGVWAGHQLTDLLSRYPVEILGKAVAETYHNRFPLLAKIIDAHQDLSIQVHPDDEMAMREHGKMGKSEMWYILDAEPGSYLYAGFKEQITPEEFKRLIEASSLAPLGWRSASDGTSKRAGVPKGRERGLTSVLARHEVHPGDVFYLPSGRVHAICGGIRLAEIQQSSDVTYRIYDYNRPGLDGRPRELHTELASRAIDYKVYDNYKTVSKSSLQMGDRGGMEELLNTPYFSIKVVETSESFHRNMIKYDSFIILMNIGDTDCIIRTRATQDEITLPVNQSCLIPACMADYDILPQMRNGKSSNGKCLEAFINNKKSISQQISDFFHLT